MAASLRRASSIATDGGRRRDNEEEEEEREEEQTTTRRVSWGGASNANAMRHARHTPAPHTRHAELVVHDALLVVALAAADDDQGLSTNGDRDWPSSPASRNRNRARIKPGARGLQGAAQRPSSLSTPFP